MKMTLTSPINGLRYRNIATLLRVYRLMEAYMRENEGTPPAISDLVWMGASPSTSVVQYYKRQMRKLGMIRYKDRISRSLILLPLEQADPLVVAELFRETSPLTKFYNRDNMELSEKESEMSKRKTRRTLVLQAPKGEMKLIHEIAVRAVNLAKEIGYHRDLLTMEMDITACHLNGNPLDLVGLLEAENNDFAHDVFGIQRHLDRQTGELLDCFVPRLSQQEQGEVDAIALFNKFADGLKSKGA